MAEKVTLAEAKALGFNSTKGITKESGMYKFAESLAPERGGFQSVGVAAPGQLQMTPYFGDVTGAYRLNQQQYAGATSGGKVDTSAQARAMQENEIKALVANGMSLEEATAQVSPQYGDYGVPLISKGGYSAAGTPTPGGQYDSSGNFVMSRDFTSYSSKAISPNLGKEILGSAKLPTTPLISETSKGILIGNSSMVFQGGKPLGNVATTLEVKSFENGNAYGFSAPGKTGLIKLPQYFLDEPSTRRELLESDVPAPLKISKFTTPTSKSSFVYKYPSWWDASPAASRDLTTKLNDGSSVVYRWYKFVDQPALQRFALNASEKKNLQKAVIKIQKDWARSPMMASPSKGSLISFDSGLLTTPPKNLEYGYVPIVIKQFLSTKSTSK